MDETITSFADRVIELAEKVIVRQGGERLWQGGKVVDAANIVPANDVLDLLRLGAVQNFERSTGGVLVVGQYPNIRRHHACRAVALDQGRHQFLADLTKRARDKNFPHIAVFR